MRQLSIRFILVLAISGSAFFARAATIVAVVNGSWVSPGTWSCGCLPGRTDTIIIPQNITVAITRPLTFGPSADGKALVITVAGELDLTSGSIQLDAVDRIIVLPGGKVSTRNFGGMIFSGVYALYLEGGTHVRGPATLGDGFFPLALLYFTAEKKGEDIALTWASAGEINIDKYTISRSTDGVTFDHVGTVAGRGYSRRQKNYSFTDSHRAAGTMYYRIDATDADGVRATIATLDLGVEDVEPDLSIFTDEPQDRP
jgi:hypothetical protein